MLTIVGSESVSARRELGEEVEAPPEDTPGLSDCANTHMTEQAEVTVEGTEGRW
jgi:hypothetical protein